jgi:hypothetical protein
VHLEYLTENLVENRLLIVHLWDISGTPAIFTRCNCRGASQSHPTNDKSTTISAMAIEPGWQRFMPTSPQADLGRLYPMVQAQAQVGAYTNPMVAPAQRMATPMDIIQISSAMNRMQLDSRNTSQIAQYQMYQAAQAHQYQQQQLQRQQQQQQQQRQQQQQQQQQRQSTQLPMYAANATGTPINISQGIVRTECRGIFVNGLNYKARTKDIENHFGKAGQIAKVDLQKDPQTGKSKGNCTIQYTNAESAARAIAMFHEQSFMTLRLNVRRDKEATPIDAPSSSNARSAQAGKTNPEPIIVNGSQVRQALVSI